MATYTVEDHNDRDREDPIIDTFDNKSEAVQFAEEWAEEFGDCEIRKNGDHLMDIRPQIEYSV